MLITQVFQWNTSLYNIQMMYRQMSQGLHEGKPNFARTDIRESVKRVKVLQLKKIEIEIEKCLIGDMYCIHTPPSKGKLNMFSLVLELHVFQKTKL